MEVITGHETIRPGYKATDIGTIPVEWEEATIGGVSRISVGRDLREDLFSPICDATYKFPVYSNTVENFGLYGFYSASEYDGESVTVVGRGVGLGTAFARAGGYGAIGRLIVLFPNEQVDSRFLAAYINLKVTIFHESSGIPQLTGIQISKYKIAVPPIREQRAIAEALEDLDNLIDVLDRLIGKKRDLKRAVVHQLLTGKRRLPGFSEDWEVRRLDDNVDSIVGGGTPRRSDPVFWGGDIPWVTVKDFATFNSLFAQESITKEGLNNSASHLIPRGTVITSTRMALGKAVIYDVDVAINQDLKAIFPTKDLDSRFLYYWFQQNAEYIDGLGNGSTVKGISLSDLRNISFLTPSLLEQIAIVEVLADMDAEIAALEQRRDKTRALKQGMMQELLTGKTRLI